MNEIRLEKATDELNKLFKDLLISLDSVNARIIVTGFHGDMITGIQLADINDIINNNRLLGFVSMNFIKTTLRN